MTALYIFIIINIIFGTLSLHWVLAGISLQQDATKYWKFKHLSVAWGSNADLMLTKVKFQQDAADFSDAIILDAFGCSFCLSFGKSFSNTESEPKYYGFHSTNGELIWNRFFLGKMVFNSAWDTTAIPILSQCLTDDGTFSETKTPWFTMEYVNYLGKNNRMTNMDKVDVYFIVKEWTSRLAFLFRVGHIFHTRVICIALVSDQTFGTSDKKSVAIYGDDNLNLLYEQYIKSKESGKTYKGLDYTNLYECINEYSRMKISAFMLGERLY